MLEDPDQLLVETYVDEANIRQVQVGDPVLLRLPAFEQRYTGHVQQVVAAADPVAHRFLVKIRLPEGVAALAGSYVQVRFTTGERPALLVPRSALVGRAGLPALYLVDNEGVARYRVVRTGQRLADGRVEITAGLKAGDRYVTTPTATLTTGVRVTEER